MVKSHLQYWVKHMHDELRAHFAHLESPDGAVRFAALTQLLHATEAPVAWAYDVWDDLVARLRHADNHQRAIAAQLLANLAVSDPEQRMLRDLDALFAVTHDPKFVTARHTLQSLWRVGIAGEPQRSALIERLVDRFHNCAGEKNATLIRYDIVEGLRKLYDREHDAAVREAALTLIAAEPDEKYRKKYAALWKRS
jgi:hypothetical protein